ncbi:uncharacterized protein [Prorops nasuta]|uniref:uncharacterized protein n=1 Tax=Prorops nasuta TaxID=863751 RepID=UPI0034CF9B0E
MRKYYQAVLAIVAVGSLISLLVYRHEYNRLRYVLEVFNYFGKPGQRSDVNCTFNSFKLSKLKHNFDFPTPAWQRVDSDLYIYSAYNIHKNKVHAIAIAAQHINLDIACSIFLENNITEIPGTFQYKRMQHTEEAYNLDYSGYYFICLYDEKKLATRIKFTISSKPASDSPIFPIKSQIHSHNLNSSVVCVAPPLKKPISNSDLFTFLNFHEMIGLGNFIVYDFGISSHLILKLKEMSNSQVPYWKLAYTTVPWNFPYTDANQNMIKDIIEADCLYRTYNKVTYSMVLSWEEYIVLKYHHLFDDLMRDFNKTFLTADKYKLKMFTFCTEQKDHSTNFTLSIFRKTFYNPTVIQSRSTYIYKPYETLNKANLVTRDAGKDLISINRYQSCKTNVFKHETGIYDDKILRFAPELQDTHNFRKFIDNSLFS